MFLSNNVLHTGFDIIQFTEDYKISKKYTMLE